MMKQLFIIILLTISPYESADFKVTDQVFFEIESDGQYFGQIIIGLFGDEAPKTVRNFKEISTNGINGTTYEGTIFHRVIEKFLIQGGDIINHDGTGSISIFGNFFKDENFTVKHNGPGYVSMANDGPDTNGCQFFITTIQTPWLNGRHVVFGKVLKGQDVVHKIEHVKTNSNDKPLNDVIIIRSGIVPMKVPFLETNEPYELTLWAWIKAGWFPLSFSFVLLIFFHWFMKQLDRLKAFE